MQPPEGLTKNQLWNVVQQMAKRVCSQKGVNGDECFS